MEDEDDDDDDERGEYKRKEAKKERIKNEFHFLFILRPSNTWVSYTRYLSYRGHICGTSSNFWDVTLRTLG